MKAFFGRVWNGKFWGINVNGPGLVKAGSAPALRTTGPQGLVVLVSGLGIRVKGLRV